MSRVGKQPIVVPTGVDVRIDGSIVTVKGGKGHLSFVVGRGVNVDLQAGVLQLTCGQAADKQCRANFGTARALIANMVHGVNTGWKKSLELSGVGFTAKLVDQKLILSVGFSHDVIFPVPAGVTCVVTKTTIVLDGCDKEVIGDFAAKIRNTQPPEPYLGKGIRYANEVVRRKAGKTGKK